MALGKRTRAVREGVDRDKTYPIEEAVKMVKERAKAKFDETIEIAMNLGVDPRHADQMVRGVVNLPNGSGRSVRVGVFARGAKADEAKAAGADVVGAEDLVEKVQGGNIDFDRCIATPDLMPLVGRLGKVLGPRGMMPNPKVGTVTMDVAGAVKGAKGGSVEFRVEKAGIVQAGVGKASFSAEKLVAEHQGVRRRGAEGQARGRQGHLHQPGRGVVHHGTGREGRAEFRAGFGRHAAVAVRTSCRRHSRIVDARARRGHPRLAGSGPTCVMADARHDGRYVARLLQLDARVVDDLAQPRRVVGDAPGEFLRRCDEDVGRLLRNDAADIRVARRLDELIVEPFHDRRRGAGRRHHAVPHVEVEAGKSRLRHGRNVRRSFRALQPGDREDSDLASRGLFAGRDVGCEQEVDAAAHHVGHRGAGAAERHVHHRRADPRP